MSDIFFKKQDPNDLPKVSDAMREVYDVMKAKGYQPINQFVGYLLSDDPSYFTSSVRSKIRRFERDEILEELLKKYFEG
ncbi:MAG: IreB family regulatory phosphoprotein [Oscillospiraceae bacterium]|nr:IreB family regulatory phosphoprotein [Oscillospiraceae bacterium]